MFPAAHGAREGTSLRSPAFALALAAILAACSEDDPAPPGCYDSVLGICRAGASFTEVDCNATSNGTWHPKGCPSDGRVAICTKLVEGENREFHYYAPTYTVGIADAACRDGSFMATAPPAGGPPATGSCNFGLAQRCTDIAGPANDLAVLAEQCRGLSRNWSGGPCPVIGRTGTCSSSAAFLSFQVRYYALSPADAEAAAANCAATGDTWTPD